jgi:hypothetical protein
MSEPRPELDPHVRLELDALSRKRNGFLDAGRQVRVLAIGSSHGAYGFDASRLGGAYNLCTTSQDLAHSRLLYDFAVRNGAPLSDVVVFYSVFSEGLELARTDDRWRCAVMKEVFALDHDYGDPLIDQEFARCAGVSSGLRASNELSGYVHEPDPWFFPESYGAERRANDHLKHRARGGQNGHLARLVEQARAAGQQVLVVLSPARADYRAHLPPPEELFADLYALERAEGGFDILNLFDHPAFAAEEFGDFDHLHPHRAGPGKLVRIVADRLTPVSG